ncbi:CubicO group peptidase, beta-lactamase class C family [Thermomonospora echinospora]|uniref:CubicO group peptidase, beta-lactamase class C family n=1 Tax=Thermomonospora echinospora TaxID=1992 RepID=A0A1H6BND0_9ACTN|nr:serine hydrolase domain-containing protein [Thermomonospora echinospora]SEG62184.1 CubicO group peptidase, beta-lactamase class C family [Thermomonospora echinospora]
MTTHQTPVQGHCDPAFKAVRDRFEESFARGREVGAAVTVYAGDRLVVDLWGGVADHRTGRAWLPDTPCVAFSCSKAVTATAALLLAERGAYDVTGPVTDWWPEFGAHGKEGVTAEHLLSHQAGLPAFAGPVSAQEAADPAAMAALLAGQAPEWTPGEAHGYHALTFGWLAGEIVRRHAGRSVGEFVRDEFAGELDLWLGAPPEVIERAARLTARRSAAPQDPGPRADDPRPVRKDGAVLARLAQAAADPAGLLNRATNNPDPGKGGYNNPVVLAGGWPAAGMVTTASALAGFYRDLVAGRVLKHDTLRDALRRRVHGPDRVMVEDTSFGLGYMRPAASFFTPPAGVETAFGHSGASGATGLGDLEAGIAMAYIPNLMGGALSADLRAYRLVEAVYASLG